MERPWFATVVGVTGVTTAVVGDVAGGPGAGLPLAAPGRDVGVATGACGAAVGVVEPRRPPAASTPALGAAFPPPTVLFEACPAVRVGWRAERVVALRPGRRMPSNGPCPTMPTIASAMKQAQSPTPATPTMRNRRRRRPLSSTKTGSDSSSSRKIAVAGRAPSGVVIGVPLRNPPGSAAQVSAVSSTDLRRLVSDAVSARFAASTSARPLRVRTPRCRWRRRGRPH